MTIDATDAVKVSISWQTSVDLAAVDLVDEHSSTELSVQDAAAGEVDPVLVGHEVDSTTGHTFELYITETDETGFRTGCTVTW